MAATPTLEDIYRPPCWHCGRDATRRLMLGDDLKGEYCTDHASVGLRNLTIKLAESIDRHPSTLEPTP